MFIGLFQLRETQVLVLSPTRELAVQIQKVSSVLAFYQSPDLNNVVNHVVLFKIANLKCNRFRNLVVLEKFEMHFLSWICYANISIDISGNILLLKWFPENWRLKMMATQTDELWQTTQNSGNSDYEDVLHSSFM